MLQSLIDESQKNVSGEVKVKLYKGNCSLVGRRSPKSIYSEVIVTFEAGNNYDQKDADGFIKLNALRLQQRKRVK
jgi:argininosuccinate synthase